MVQFRLSKQQPRQARLGPRDSTASASGVLHVAQTPIFHRTRGGGNRARPGIQRRIEYRSRSAIASPVDAARIRLRAAGIHLLSQIGLQGAPSYGVCPVADGESAPTGSPSTRLKPVTVRFVPSSIRPPPISLPRFTGGLCCFGYPPMAFCLAFLALPMPLRPRRSLRLNLS